MSLVARIRPFALSVALLTRPYWDYPDDRPFFGIKTGRHMTAFKLLFAIVALSALASTTANAQNYPWCAQYGGSMGGSMNCGFTSFAQCQADVSGIGGFCVQNNTYQPQGASRAHQRRAKNSHP
jgi:hypothetical protein